MAPGLPTAEIQEELAEVAIQQLQPFRAHVNTDLSASQERNNRVVTSEFDVIHHGQRERTAFVETMQRNVHDSLVTLDDQQRRQEKCLREVRESGQQTTRRAHTLEDWARKGRPVRKQMDIRRLCDHLIAGHQIHIIRMSRELNEQLRREMQLRSRGQRTLCHGVTRCLANGISVCLSPTQVRLSRRTYCVKSNHRLSSAEKPGQMETRNVIMAGKLFRVAAKTPTMRPVYSWDTEIKDTLADYMADARIRGSERSVTAAIAIVDKNTVVRRR